MYTHRMMQFQRSIGISAWLSLFMLQLSGLHTHADENGFLGKTETGYSHVHISANDHQSDQGFADHGHEVGHANADHVHDYEDARDLSVFELASGKLELSLALLAVALLLCASLGVPSRLSPCIAYRLLSGCHTRWRPPLRAPPAHA